MQNIQPEFIQLTDAEKTYLAESTRHTVRGCRMYENGNISYPASHWLAWAIQHKQGYVILEDAKGREMAFAKSDATPVCGDPEWGVEDGKTITELADVFPIDEPALDPVIRERIAEYRAAALSL